MDIKEISKEVTTDYSPLTLSAIRRVRFANDIINKIKFNNGIENKDRI